MDHVICHFEIPADDMDKIKTFYSELFGWEITKMPGPMEYFMIKTGGVDGGLMKKQHPQQTPTNYISVESVDAHMQKVTGLGGTIVVPKMPVPGMGWFAVGVDPEGNCFGMWEEDKEAK